MKTQLGDPLTTRDLLRWGTACLSPTGKRSRVIITIPWAVWVRKNVGPMTNQEAKQQNLQGIMHMVEPLRAPGSSVVVCLLKYPYDAVKRNQVTNNGRAESACQMGSMTNYNHLACEVDDYFLSLLHCRLIMFEKAVQAISKDRGVIKPVFEQKAIRHYMEKSGWAFEVEVIELFWSDYR